MRQVCSKQGSYSSSVIDGKLAGCSAQGDLFLPLTLPLTWHFDSVKVRGRRARGVSSAQVRLFAWTVFSLASCGNLIWRPRSGFRMASRISLLLLCLLCSR